MWTLLVTVVLGLGVSAIATATTRSNWSTMSPSSIRGFDPTALSLVGVFIAQFAIGVLGVLAMSAEYSTGTIRSVFAAAPHRNRVLLAKILVFTTIAIIVAEFVCFASFFLGQAILSSPATHATLSSPGALRAVTGCGLYVATLGLLGVGLATIIRHSAAAISAFVGILLILPILVQTLPNSLALEVRRFLPDHIGATMITTNNGFVGTGAFAPWVGLLILVGYAVAANVIGAVLLARRDA
jgi:ABC-type transport system involved in multi-copper enzyme maturation permease subunit